MQDDLLGLKRDIERQLRERLGNRGASAGPGAAADAFGFAAAPTGLNNVIGVGLGVARAGHRGGTVARPDTDDGRDGPGAPTLLLYVVEPTSESRVRGAVAKEMNVRAVAESSTPVATVVTGVIDARAHRMRLRPAPCGSSVSHVQVTAGTFGALARGRTGERRGRLLVVSNNTTTCWPIATRPR